MADFDRRILKIALDRYAAGLSDAARTLIIDYVRQYPGDEEGWLSLSHVLEDSAKKADCLRRALTINPNCQEAKTALIEIYSGLPVSQKHQPNNQRHQPQIPFRIA